MNYETKEPCYIEESNDILTLKKFYTPDELKIQQGHWVLGFTLLTNTLFITYGNTLFSTLVINSKLHEESIIFSKNLKKVIEINEWSNNTANISFCVLKKILRKTNIDQGFISKISILKDKKIKRDTAEFCLPSKYKKLSCDDENRQIILNWIVRLKRDTKYKSQSSIRMVISFMIALFSQLNIPVSQDILFSNMDFDTIKQSIIDTHPNFPLKTKVNYTMNFMCLILNESKYIKQFELYKKSINIKKQVQEDSDKHRISKEELELIFEASKENIRNNTLFLLMATTGLRACGVSNIKLDNITNLLNGKITINKSGRTIEKGNKWFTFPISDSLSKLLLEYISNNRKSNSSYLFPGRGEDIGISTNRINSIIKEIALKANVKGPHIHAHSIRHSFAHILLESGNKPELVSKMLGHSSTKTTEEYYLKESALEVSKRANIPWLVRQEYSNPVPDFLDINRPVKTRKSKSDRNKILKNLAKDFVK
jgi:integrase